MMDLRKAAVPAIVLVSGALLAGCGDTTDGDTLDTDNTVVPGLEDDMMEPTP